MDIKSLNLPRDTEEQRMAQDNLIFLTYAGSQMYGTATPESDLDMIGVFIPNEDYVIGRKVCNLVEFKTNSSSSGKPNKAGDRDMNIYSLPFFLGLALNNNPNILELFFSPENCRLIEEPEWVKLKGNADKIVSLKCYHSFRGYAHSQLMRLKIKTGNNSGRKDLIEKYGYDTKLAHHAIRLYLECVQLMKEGQITFPLAESNLLVQFKTGKFTKEEFFKKSEELSNLCGITYANSNIAYSPNHDAVNEVQMTLIKDYWRKNNG